MNFLSGRGAEEPTVYGWNTKVSAPSLMVKKKVMSTAKNFIIFREKTIILKMKGEQLSVALKCSN